jgi:hypothetical protein
MVILLFAGRLIASSQGRRTLLRAATFTLMGSAGGWPRTPQSGIAARKVSQALEQGLLWNKASRPAKVRK